MSTRGGRRITFEEIDRVKDLIERCILDYMKKKEVVNFLYQQHNIEPCFTKIVWERLEEENKQFFRNYYLRLAVKDQITRFNDLMEKQDAIIKQMNPNELNAIPPIDLPQIGLNDYGSSGSQHNSSEHQLDTSVAHNMNGGMLEQGLNNGIIPLNDESGNLGNSGSVSSSSNMELNSHHLERTFTADLSAFMSSYSESLFDHSNDITVDTQRENNGVANILDNYDFQNSGLVETSNGPTTSNTMQVENGSL